MVCPLPPPPLFGPQNKNSVIPLLWAIIKSLGKKILCFFKYIVFTDSLSCLQALQCVKLKRPLIRMVIRKLCRVLMPRLVYPIMYQPLYYFHLARWLEWCEHSSFSQTSPVRLAVLLHAVQEGWNCLVSCPHRSYTFDPFVHLEERSFTSVWALSVYYDRSSHFGGVQ